MSYGNRFLLIGLSLSFITGAGIYLAKDAIIHSFFGDSGGESTMLAGSASSTLAASVKNCSFETTESPSHGPVIVNEIAWMGSAASANEEWIELKNISSGNVSARGWRLLNRDGKTKIILGNSADIPAGGFYLLAREKNSVADEKANVVYGGTLKNSGDSLRLFDKDCHLIDEVIADSGWTAGDNVGKHTMERDSATLLWHTSALAGGTPKHENTSAPKPKTTITNQVLLNQPSPAQTLLPLSSNTINHLLISEIMIGIDGVNNYTFIEFYNPTANPVDLTGWTVKKKTSTGIESPLIVPDRLKNKIVRPGKYFLTANDAGYTGAILTDVKWPSSYALAYANNTVTIYDASGTAVDSIHWDNIPKNQSYERDSSSSNGFHLQTAPNPQNSVSQ